MALDIEDSRHDRVGMWGGMTEAARGRFAAELELVPLEDRPAFIKAAIDSRASAWALETAERRRRERKQAKRRQTAAAKREQAKQAAA